MRWTIGQLKWIENHKELLDSENFLTIKEGLHKTWGSLTTYEVAILELALAKLCGEKIEIHLYDRKFLCLGLVEDEYDFEIDTVFISESLKKKLNEFSDLKIKNWVLREYLESGSINSSEKEFIKEILAEATINRYSFEEDN